MRIEVFGGDWLSQQARTYAEYRLFAALSHLADTERVRHVRLVLRRSNHRGRDGVSCAVTVYREGAGYVRVRASGDHPYAAINQAVELLRMGGPGSGLTPGDISERNDASL